MTKLQACNRTLLMLTAMAGASGVQLEILQGKSVGWIWFHIIICLIFIAMCSWHIWLHFKAKNWFVKFSKQKSVVTKGLWWISLITFTSGIIATTQWLAHGTHTSAGGVHGKLGFVMIVLAVAHAIKRRKFFLKRNRTAHQGETQKYFVRQK